MSADIHAFASELTRLYEVSGLPRSVALVVTHLTICQPAQQTAASLQRQLGLSAGSVSTALTMLHAGGLITRRKTPGERHYVYELDSEAWERSMWQRLAALDQLSTVAERGVRLMPNNDRLTAMRDIYQYFGQELSGLLRRYEQHHSGRHARS